MEISDNGLFLNILVSVGYLLFLCLVYRLVFLWRKADIPELAKKISLDENFLTWNYLYILLSGAFIAIPQFLKMAGFSDVFIFTEYLEVIGLYLLCLLLYQWMKVLKRTYPEHASGLAALSMDVNRGIEGTRPLTQVTQIGASSLWEGAN